MLLGLVADTHDDEGRTRRAFEVLDKASVDVVLHAGDVTSPGIVEEHLDGRRAWVALGNMDRNRKALRQAGQACSPTVPVARKHEIEAGSGRVGLVHGDDQGRLQSMINAGVFQLVVHGHTHEFRDERIGSTRVVNPGAVHRTGEPSVCTYDVEADRLERHRVADG